jgi:hypothetical protein
MRSPFVSLWNSRFAFGVFFAATAIATSAGLANAQVTIQALSGAHQQTTYGSSFTAPVVVWVHNPATERSIAGAKVTFTAGPSVGLSAATGTTDERGLVRITVRGLLPGEASIAARVEGVAGAEAHFDGMVVHKAVLTVVPVNAESHTGQVPEVTEYTLQGFVNGDTEDSAQIAGAPVLTTAATDHSPDADYAIKGNPGTLVSPKYAFEAGFGTLVMVGDKRAADKSQDLATALAGVDDFPNSVRRALVGQAATTLPNPLYAGSRRAGSPVNLRPAVTATADGKTKTAPPEVKGVLTSVLNVLEAPKLAVKGSVGLPTAAASGFDATARAKVKTVASLEQAKRPLGIANQAVGPVHRAMLVRGASEPGTAETAGVKSALHPDVQSTETALPSAAAIRQAFPPASR